MSYQALKTLLENRRSHYQLNKELPVEKAQIQNILEDIVLHTPSSFNSQSTRIIALFGEEHDTLWQHTEEALKKIVPEENFASTAEKLALFKQGAGTVLFFEDQNVVEDLQKQFPLYAENFPIWSEQTNAMHQHALWLAFTSLDIGANLQHYNPLIDDAVAKTWHAPKNWKLRAQMVFGGIAGQAGEKSFNDLESRLKIYGA